MWNYRKNDYAANKYSPNIVYRFNDEIIEISLEDYLEENPDRMVGGHKKVISYFLRNGVTSVTPFPVSAVLPQE